MSKEAPPQPEPPRLGPPPEQAPPPPWRTEGLPKGTPPKKPLGWASWLPWLVGYALVFAIVTLQDRFAGPQVVPYTDFKAQVAAHNVEEVFARGNTIQGALKQARPVPGQKGQTYQQFTTERPTFAADDLLSELEASQATVRATPLVLARGFLTIIGALGGMAAEQEVFGVGTSGAESDLEQVTRIARSMVGRWGMSEKVGAVSVLPAEGDPRLAGVSDATLDLVDEEVHRLSDTCLAEARRLVRENRGRLEAIVAQLLAHETLDEAAVYAAAGLPRPAAAEEAPAHAAAVAHPVATTGGRR